jgi:hypothetical protein
MRMSSSGQPDVNWRAPDGYSKCSNCVQSNYTALGTAFDVDVKWTESADSICPSAMTLNPLLGWG